MIDNSKTINENLVQATIFENATIIKKLIKYGGDITQGAVFQALYFNDVATLDLLIQEDAKYNNYFEKATLFPMLEPLCQHDNLDALVILDKHGLKEKLDVNYVEQEHLFSQSFTFLASNTLGYLLEKMDIFKNYSSISPIMKGFSGFIEPHQERYYDNFEQEYTQFLQTMYDFEPDLTQQLMLYAIAQNIGKIFSVQNYEFDYLKGFQQFGIDPFKKLKDYTLKPIKHFDYQRLLLEPVKHTEKEECNCLDLFYSDRNTDFIEKQLLEITLDSQNTKPSKAIKI